MKKRSDDGRPELEAIAELAAEEARSAVLKGVPSPAAMQLASARAQNAELVAKTVREFLQSQGAAGGEILFDALAHCSVGGAPFDVRYLDEQRKTIAGLFSHSPEERQAARRIGEKNEAKELAAIIRGHLKVDPGRTTEVIRRELKARNIEIPELFGDAPINGQKLVTATPYVWTDPSDIPKRRWLYGRQLIRGFVTVTVSPGGVGKSSLTMVEALSMVSGRPLLGKQPEERLRAWLWNLEDPADELQRRIQAACEHYDISAEDLSDGLFVDSGRLQGLCIAQSDPKGRTVIIKPVVAALADELIARKIDVLIVDPFVSSHSVSENDNMAIDTVAKTWGRVADACGCAIHLVHHTKKQGSDAEVTAESARGGKALTDAARVVRTVNRMSAEEGREFGISNHRQFFRTYDDKSNMAPPPEISEWYELRNVVLPNGDHVGVVMRWAPPDAFDGVTTESLKAVQVAISRGDFREDIRASTWAGTVVGEVLSIDVGSPLGRHKIKRLLAKWIETGALRIELVKDEKRRDRAFVRVGEWV